MLASFWRWWSSVELVLIAPVVTDLMRYRFRGLDKIFSAQIHGVVEEEEEKEEGLAVLRIDGVGSWKLYKQAEVYNLGRFHAMDSGASEW